MKKFLASRAAFDQLKQAVEKAATVAFDDCDILVKFQHHGRELCIGSVRFIAPDSIGFAELAKDHRSVPMTIVRGGQEFLAIVDTTVKSIGSRVITGFSEIPVA